MKDAVTDVTEVEPAGGVTLSEWFRRDFTETGGPGPDTLPGTPLANQPQVPPLDLLKAIALFREARLQAAEREWEKYLDAEISYLTQEYLQAKYNLSVDSENVLINGSIIPNRILIEKIQNLNVNEALIRDNKILAVKLDKKAVASFNYTDINKYSIKEFKVWLVYRRSAASA